MSFHIGDQVYVKGSPHDWELSERIMGEWTIVRGDGISRRATEDQMLHA